jgi:hypothetical protein
MSREEIESRILEEQEVDMNRTRKAESREKSRDKGDRIEEIKREAKKNPIEKKQKLKMEEISKLI